MNWDYGKRSHKIQSGRTFEEFEKGISEIKRLLIARQLLEKYQS